MRTKQAKVSYFKYLNLIVGLKIMYCELKFYTNIKVDHINVFNKDIYKTYPKQSTYKSPFSTKTYIRSSINVCTVESEILLILIYI